MALNIVVNIGSKARKIGIYLTHLQQHLVLVVRALHHDSWLAHGHCVWRVLQQQTQTLLSDTVDTTTAVVAQIPRVDKPATSSRLSNATQQHCLSPLTFQQMRGRGHHVQVPQQFEQPPPSSPPPCPSLLSVDQVSPHPTPPQLPPPTHPHEPKCSEIQMPHSVCTAQLCIGKTTQPHVQYLRTTSEPCARASF
jgi:hypothetical protein